MRTLLFLLALLLPLPLVAEGGAGRLVRLVEQLDRLQVDTAQPIMIERFVLQREGGRFDLLRGTLHFLQPIEGRSPGLLFRGEGSFTFDPRDEVERQQIARTMGSPRLTREFTSLLLLATDSTVEELRRASRGPASSQDPAPLVAAALPYLFAGSDRADPSALEAFASGSAIPFFASCFFADPAAPLMFRVNPFAEEEVQVLRRVPTSISERRDVELISSVRAASAAPGLVRRRVEVPSYRVELGIGSGLDVDATARLVVKSAAAGSRWIPFGLHRDLRVRSASLGDGGSLPFLQDGAGTLWLEVPAGESDINIAYGGGLFDRSGDDILLRESRGWYPVHDWRQKSTFDITARTPASMVFVAVGQRREESRADDITTSRWIVERPIRNASFNLGFFSRQRIERDSVPPVVVLRGRGSTAGLAEQVGSDVAAAIHFFSYLYGPLPIDTFYATEIPAWHGEAFPGLIHLSLATFAGNDRSGGHELFRAHEVAHQWWGIGVDFASYHDQWLSEAFAEYSGLMYMQGVMKENDSFFRTLRDYRDQIVSVRRPMIGSGVEPGPIWLGARNEQGSTRGDYDLIVYRKGAWVLHMLRNMMLDLNTMSEDRYRAMMREFFSTYGGSSATIADFQRVVEKHVGGSMEWFFRQWVRGSAIPSYSWSWKDEEVDGGKHRLRLRVRSENVPAGFQMYVPIRVDFGEGRIARLRLLVRAGEEEPQIPLMPMKVRDVVFNEFESVLCEADEE